MVALQNPFPIWVKEVFSVGVYCFKCGRTDQGIELHHIVGRTSCSPFNACRLCHVCHELARHTKEDEYQYSMLTHSYLCKVKFISRDIE